MLTSGDPPETRTRVLTYGHSPGPLKHDIDLGLKVCKPRTGTAGNESRGVGGRESSTGAVSLDAEAEAAPSTGNIAAPVASAARAARKLESAARPAGEICGKRGVSTHPFDPGTVFPLEVRYSSDEQAKYNSSGSSSSSSNDNTSDRDSWWEAMPAECEEREGGSQCRSSF